MATFYRDTISENAAVPGVPAVAAVCCRPGSRTGAALMLQPGHYFRYLHTIQYDVPSIYDTYRNYIYIYTIQVFLSSQGVLADTNSRALGIYTVSR